MQLTNKIQCNICKDIIESLHGHDFKFCSCGAVAVDGGRSYLRRLGNPKDYTDLSESVSKEDVGWFEKAREHFTWTSFGVGGRGPVRRILLKNIETDHIRNILKTQYHIQGSYVEELFKMELHRRGHD